MPYIMNNRTDLAIRMDSETGQCHVLIESQITKNEVELTEYVWVLVQEDK